MSEYGLKSLKARMEGTIIPPAGILVEAAEPILAINRKILNEKLLWVDADDIELWVDEGIARACSVLSLWYGIGVPRVITTGQAYACEEDVGCPYRQAAMEALEGYESLVGTAAVTVSGLILYNIYVFLPETSDQKTDPEEFVRTLFHEFYHHLLISETPVTCQRDLLLEPTLSAIEEWAQLKADECMAMLPL